MNLLTLNYSRFSADQLRRTSYLSPQGKVSSKQGFTLLELSVVLVIIGLIVGGVIVGQTMIASFRLRSVITESDRLKSAITTFQTKFNCIPGDCPNAYTFFSGSGCTNNTTQDPLGCNGDGNGYVDNTGNWPERTKIWGHLSLAQLIAGNYDLTLVGGANEIKADPPSSFSPANSHYEMTNGNIRLGNNYNGQPNLYSAAALFTPNQARFIDQKMDDGFNTTGSVTGHWGLGLTGASCWTVGGDGYPTSSQYADVVGCTLTFSNLY